jgi:hypothetical protein
VHVRIRAEVHAATRRAQAAGHVPVQVEPSAAGVDVSSERSLQFERAAGDQGVARHRCSDADLFTGGDDVTLGGLRELHVRAEGEMIGTELARDSFGFVRAAAGEQSE